MLQASVCDSCSLEALSLSEDCLGPSKVDVGRGLADRLQRSTKSPILILPPRELERLRRASSWRSLQDPYRLFHPSKHALFSTTHTF